MPFEVGEDLAVGGGVESAEVADVEACFLGGAEEELLGDGGGGTGASSASSAATSA